MEFEKLREIIADVMNIEESEITEDASFKNDIGCIPDYHEHRRYI